MARLYYIAFRIEVNNNYEQWGRTEGKMVKGNIPANEKAKNMKNG